MSRFTVIGDVYLECGDGLDPSPGGPAYDVSRALLRSASSVELFSIVGDDAPGQMLITALEETGIPATSVRRHPSATTEIRACGKICRPGTRLVKRDQIDIGRLFGGDVCVVCVSDQQLLRFLVDLPAHTNPTIRLLGLLSSLSTRPADQSELIAARFDALAGSSDHLIQLTGQLNAFSACKRIQGQMRGENLRLATIALGDVGTVAISENGIFARTVEAIHRPNDDSVEPMLAAGTALAMLRRSDLQTTLETACAQAFAPE